MHIRNDVGPWPQLALLIDGADGLDATFLVHDVNVPAHASNSEGVVQLPEQGIRPEAHVLNSRERHLVLFGLRDGFDLSVHAWIHIEPDHVDLAFPILPPNLVERPHGVL